MKSKNRIVWSVVLGGMIVCGNAMATAVFEFRADSVFDQAGIGATATQLDAEAKTKITMKTVDVIGKDGSRASEGAGHQTFINTGVHALGINSTDTIYGGLEFQDFNPGEAWVIVFDVDVNLVEIDLASQDEGAEMTISSSAFKDIVLQDGASRDIHDLENTAVPAGTAISFKMTSSSSAADTSMRIASLTVASAKAGKK